MFVLREPNVRQLRNLEVGDTVAFHHDPTDSNRSGRRTTAITGRLPGKFRHSTELVVDPDSLLTVRILFVCRIS